MVRKAKAFYAQNQESFAASFKLLLKPRPSLHPSTILLEMKYGRSRRGSPALTGVCVCLKACAHGVCVLYIGSGFDNGRIVRGLYSCSTVAMAMCTRSRLRVIR